MITLITLLTWPKIWTTASDISLKQFLMGPDYVYTLSLDLTIFIAIVTVLFVCSVIKDMRSSSKDER